MYLVLAGRDYLLWGRGWKDFSFNYVARYTVCGDRGVLLTANGSFLEVRTNVHNAPYLLAGVFEFGAVPS